MADVPDSQHAITNVPIQSSSRILDAISQASLDALITIDVNGRIVDFSPSAEQIFGFRKQEVVGLLIQDVVIPQQLRQAHVDGMKNYLATGVGPVLNNRVEVPALHREGHQFDAELTVVPLEVDGQPMFMAFIRDISERKNNEAKTEAALQSAELASQAKSRFLAHMSHEIRSPLNAVLASVDLLDDTELSERQRRIVDTAAVSGRSLLSLVNQILDFSRIEADQRPVRSEVVNLDELLSEFFTGLYLQAAARENMLICCMDCDVPSIIQSDFGSLRQTLTNIVQNSIKFTEAGTVSLTISLANAHNPESHDEEIVFAVRDTGVGIPKDQLDTLFDEFSQVDQSYTTQHDGAGLGLAIVRGLVKSLGGRVEVHSVLNEGSEFIVSIPMIRADDSRMRGVGGLSGNVLVVTSDHMLGNAMERQVGGFGFDVEITSAEMATYQEKNYDGIHSIIIDVRYVDPCDSHLQELLESMEKEGRVSWIAVSDKEIDIIEGAGWSRVLRSPVLPVDVAEIFRQGGDRPADESSVADGAASTRQVLHGKHLLVVEDSAANQFVASAILESMGARVSVAGNGVEALEFLDHTLPDLVLMDLRMPKMDGIEATKRIRALDGVVSRVPVLALSANAVESEIQKCLDAGMNDFVTKPIGKHVILRKIKQALHL